MSIDERVKNLYKLAKQHPNDTHLQEAADVVKFLRRSQGSLQGWNERYRTVNAELNSEIVQISQTNELLEVEREALQQEMLSLTQDNEKYRTVNAELNSEIVQISQTNKLLEVERETLTQEMLSLTQERARIIAQREKVIAELKTIHTEVDIATAKVKATQSLFGKFSILWSLIQSLFFSDRPEDFGKIEHSILLETDKPQMGNDTASIQKSLLDK